ncbi:hypothetical protein NONI108955_23315 [Nocardia ninae]
MTSDQPRVCRYCGDDIWLDEYHSWLAGPFAAAQCDSHLVRCLNCDREKGHLACLRCAGDGYETGFHEP